MLGLALFVLTWTSAASVGDPKKVTRYALELEWRPSYCMMTYCPPSWKVNEFAITSLRTQGRTAKEAEDCICDETMASLRPDTKKQMAKYFPTRELETNSEGMWKEQWEKFGCCMESRDRPNRYFKRTLDMFQALSVLDTLEQHGVKPGGMVFTKDFRAAFSKKISLSCTFSQLTSVRFFYNLAFDQIDAHEENHDEKCGEAFSFPALSVTRTVADL